MMKTLTKLIRYSYIPKYSKDRELLEIIVYYTYDNLDWTEVFTIKREFLSRRHWTLLEPDWNRSRKLIADPIFFEPSFEEVLRVVKKNTIIPSSVLLKLAEVFHNSSIYRETFFDKILKVIVLPVVNLYWFLAYKVDDYFESKKIENRVIPILDYAGIELKKSKNQLDREEPNEKPLCKRKRRRKFRYTLC